MSAGRRATIEIAWESKDISRDIAPYLLGLTYTDNLSGAADDLSIELEDRDGLWSGDWQPAHGDFVVARLKAEPWFTAVTDLRLGKFAHDKIALSGPPRRASLQCVSAPLATGLRRRKRTRAWNSRTLKEIATDISVRAELLLDFDSDDGFRYKRREQVDKSDLEFLEELCKEAGRMLKVTEDTIVIFDERTRDTVASEGEISLDNSGVISWNFDSDDSDRYGSCTVSFFDPRTGKLHRGTFTDADIPDGQSLDIRSACDSIGEAEDKAESLLRAANRFAKRGRLVTMGDPGLVAGVTFDLVGAYGFNGKFIITKAEHHTVGGYTCTLDVRRCIEGY